MENKKQIIDFFFERGVLLSSDFFHNLKEEDIDKLKELIENAEEKDLLILTKDVSELLKQGKGKAANWMELEKTRTELEKGISKVYSQFVDFLKKEENPKENKYVKVIDSYEEDSKERDIQDFVAYLNARYKSMELILRNRQELQNIISINRLYNKKDRETVSVIGMVVSKNKTKNNNLMLELEDPTGSIKVLINKNKPDLYAKVENTILDEVIAVKGVNGDRIVFANSVVWPELPPPPELKKCNDEVYALFLSDLHVGSNNFLEEDFMKFIKWVRGEVGSEKQKSIAEKIKYIFIAGDLVDGCGIYPNQESELIIKDVKDQYEACANYLKQIPKNINIIICPGNHDAVRIEEPQPKLYKEYSEAIYNMENVTLVSNPAFINIHGSDDFSGFNVLMYHGYSFDYIIANVDSLRNKGGYDRGDLVMKYLLKRRHLAPSHESNLNIPDTKKDHDNN
jgi:DNA polymerase II small subunit